MENLNAEQIIKALECCKTTTPEDCIECPYRNKGNSLYVGCVNTLVKDTLSLIKELTEENERLRGVGVPDNEVYIRLSDAKHAIMDYIGEQTVSKYASSAECKSARGGAEGAMNELDYLTPVNVAPIADTVREMQERLTSFFDNDEFLETAEVDAEYINEQIVNVAKEMLEGL